MKDWVILAGVGVAVLLLVRLNRKVNAMPRQEDVDLIVSNLNQVATNVAGIAEDQQALHDKLVELQEIIDNDAGDVDLTEALELSQQLVESTQTLDAAFPAPEPEPATGNDSSGGTETGGETTPITDPGSELPGDEGGPVVGGAEPTE